MTRVSGMFPRSCFSSFKYGDTIRIRGILTFLFAYNKMAVIHVRTQELT